MNVRSYRRMPLCDYRAGHGRLRQLRSRSSLSAHDAVAARPNDCQYILMKLLYFLLAASPLSACTAELTAEERATLVGDVERRVLLPEGAGDLACYQREYSIVKASNTVYLVGEYHLATRYMGMDAGDLKPGVIWEKRENLTMGFVDQGCRTLWFKRPLDDIGSSIQAKCGPTFDGTLPTKVNSPVEC